jgi:hypothetical protein
MVLILAHPLSHILRANASPAAVASSAVLAQSMQMAAAKLGSALPAA